LGAAIAQALGARGAKVAINYFTGAEKAGAVAASIRRRRRNRAGVWG